MSTAPWKITLMDQTRKSNNITIFNYYDYEKVNLLSIGMVMIILLVTFKSIALPIVLILVIESGIFINIHICYLSPRVADRSAVF